MATNNPIQQLADDISAIQTKIGWLQDNVRLAKTRDTVEDLFTKVTNMTQRIANLRQRGYVFEKELEDQASTFNKQWTNLHPILNQQINTQSSELQATMHPIEIQMGQLNAAARNPITARPLLRSVQSAVEALEDKVNAAEGTITGMYDQFDRQVYEFSKHLDEIEYTLIQLSEATFQLLPTEGGIMAVKAVWCKTGKEQKGDPNGILYLTDQRILFEQKEDVTTKKVLFVATEKKKMQQLQLEMPVAQVDKVEISKQGFLKNEDHIQICVQSNAPSDTAHFHIWQDCATWQGLINCAKSKDFDKSRSVKIDQTTLDKLKAAPSQCPSCGSNLEQVILRGQDNIKCEYCGYIIRL